MNGRSELVIHVIESTTARRWWRWWKRWHGRKCRGFYGEKVGRWTRVDDGGQKKLRPLTESPAGIQEEIIRVMRNSQSFRGHATAELELITRQPVMVVVVMVMIIEAQLRFKSCLLKHSHGSVIMVSSCHHLLFLKFMESSAKNVVFRRQQSVSETDPTSVDMTNVERMLRMISERQEGLLLKYFRGFVILARCRVGHPSRCSVFAKSALGFEVTTYLEEYRIILENVSVLGNHFTEFHERTFDLLYDLLVGN